MSKNKREQIYSFGYKDEKTPKEALFHEEKCVQECNNHEVVGYDYTGESFSEFIEVKHHMRPLYREVVGIQKRRWLDDSNNTVGGKYGNENTKNIGKNERCVGTAGNYYRDFDDDDCDRNGSDERRAETLSNDNRLSTENDFGVYGEKDCLKKYKEGYYHGRYIVRSNATDVGIWERALARTLNTMTDDDIRYKNFKEQSEKSQRNFLRAYEVLNNYNEYN